MEKNLKLSWEGIRMKLITFRSPNHKVIGNSFENGLRSFNTSRQAWWWIIPEGLRGRAHINLL